MGELVAVEVSWIVADCVGEGVSEAGEMAVGYVIASVPSGVNDAAGRLSGETCGLQAPSKKGMIRIREAVHVRINKSPLLLWLGLPG